MRSRDDVLADLRERWRPRSRSRWCPYHGYHKKHEWVAIPLKDHVCEWDYCGCTRMICIFCNCEDVISRGTDEYR